MAEQPAPTRHSLLETWFWVDDDQIPLVQWLAPTVAIGVLLVWGFELGNPQITTWDRYGTPVIAAMLMVTAVLITQLPRWRIHAILCTMLAGSVYLIGKLVQHLHFPASEPLYAVMSVAVYGPLVYLAAFAIFKRGARRYSWAHYAATVLVMAISEIGPHALESREVMQAKLMMVLIPPAYILALNFMVRLRESVHVKERAAHEDKERMLSMMTHEIRGPLQTMLSSVDLLATKVIDAPSQRALARMTAVAQQLDRHVKDLLEFNRVNNPALVLEKSIIDIEALVNQVRDKHQVDASAKGLSLDVVLTDLSATPAERERWRQAWSDPARLSQVLDNLVSNAIKYTQAGHITIGMATPLRRPDCVLIQIADTGVGIEPSDMQAIFEPFVRVIPPGMKPPEGSGLGLVISKRLVQLLGGQLNVNSSPGQGSTFSLLLPLGKAPR